MSDSLEFHANFSAGQSAAPKQLWRLVDGVLTLADRPASPIDEMVKMNGGVDAGNYYAYLSGVSDKFEEANTFPGSNGEMRDKVILEFTIIKSQKWGGASFSQYYTIPMNWGDDRSSLRHVVSALLGHELQDGEGFSLKKFVQQPSELIVSVEVKRTQDGKRTYNKAKSVQPATIQVVDDGGPGVPAVTQGVPAPQQQQPAYAGPPVAERPKTISGLIDSMSAPVIPGVDDIPF